MAEEKYTFDDIIEALKNDQEWEMPEEVRFMLDFFDAFLLTL